MRNPNQFSMFGPADEPPAPLEQEEGPKHFVSPRQYPMFMSAREITDRFAPLEGDRMIRGGMYIDDLEDEAVIELENDRSFIQQMRDEGFNTQRGLVHHPHVSNRGWEGRSRDEIQYGTSARARLHREVSHVLDNDPRYQPETDEELWDRKYEESIDAGLAEDIAEEGVRNPISLESLYWGDPSPRRQPEVLGGHHRVAVQRYERPDDLNPVQFFPSWYEAVKSPTY